MFALFCTTPRPGTLTSHCWAHGTGLGRSPIFIYRDSCTDKYCYTNTGVGMEQVNGF